MIVRIAERFQRDERIEHCGKNCGETVRPFEAFEHPLLGLLERAFAERMNVVLREPLGELVQLVEPDEKVPPGEPLGVRWQREIAFVVAFRIKFVERDVFRPARRLEMVDDGKRHEHGARPRTHLPEIHVKPFADQDDFAGNRRHVFPGEQTEQREIKPGEGVHSRHAAEAQSHLTRLQHARVSHRHARQFQSEIPFDGCVYVRRAAVIDVPAAVRQLHGKDMMDRFALPCLVHFAVPVMVGNHVGAECRIDHQFADPITFRLLEAE